MFTREIKITDYAWVIHAYEPTVQEANQLGDAQRAGDWPQVYSLWPALIKDWNCTDRKDQVLPITAEGMAQIPADVLLEMTSLLTMPRHSDPKAVSDSLHISRRVPEAKAPITLPSPS